MYPPNHHQEANFDNVVRTIKAYPLATLVSSEEDEHFITHLPLMYYPNKKMGKLVGHMDKNNPQTKYLYHEKISVVFHGPECYISPSIYKNDKQLPTWNYVKVHLSGDPQIITSQDRLKESIVKMTEFLEGEKKAFVLEQDNPQMDKIINYIVGFEIAIESWEGKFKLSQDKKGQDFDNAKEKLLDPKEEERTNYLKSIYNNQNLP